MKTKLLYIVAVLGIAAGFLSAHIYGAEKKPLPPAFNPAPNPYSKAIYANGIVESYQSNGANINIFPEVSGFITQIYAVEGRSVHQGEALLQIDDSVQRSIVEQQKAQADAAQSLLQELKAQPRKQVLEVSKAQFELATANLKTSRDQLDKIRRSYEINSKSVSKEQLDSGEDAVNAANASFHVAQKQYELTQAGAWAYDIQNQEHQYEALTKGYASSMALLNKYTVRAPVDGVVLAVNTAAGSFISSQGAYGTYTEGFDPVIVMGNPEEDLGVRCYIDEILMSRLPASKKIKALMYFRGTNVSVPLEFVRIRPYVSPKVELSNQRTERVDVRVLPVLFRFKPPEGVTVYRGQLVDVYIETG
jgi:HlyD family secretion protein